MFRLVGGIERTLACLKLWNSGTVRVPHRVDDPPHTELGQDGFELELVDAPSDGREDYEDVEEDTSCPHL